VKKRKLTPLEFRLLSLDWFDAEKKLKWFMSELSERYYFAGWMIDLEFRLWEQLVDPEAGLHNDLHPERLEQWEIDKLRELSEKAGGWCSWGKNGKGVELIPLKEWELRYDGKGWK